MNKINMAELLADREKGTEGPWRVRENARHSPEECDLTICGDIWQLADINGPQYEHQEANARRIARLPDLEAAYIEAVAEIEALKHDLARSMETANAYLNEREALTRRVAELKGALKPFAREAERLPRGSENDRYSFAGTGLSYGDLRRARATLQGDGE